MNVMGVDEAAALLRCSRWTVTRMIDRGELKASKIGRQWIITDEDIKALLKLKQKKAEPKPAAKAAGGKVWKIT